jgi:hypothetical protein
MFRQDVLDRKNKTYIQSTQLYAVAMFLGRVLFVSNAAAATAAALRHFDFALFVRVLVCSLVELI